MLNPLIDLHDSAVAPISKDSSNDPEQNDNSLLESFDSEDEIVVPPVSVQNKSSKMDMLHLPVSLDVTEMIQQALNVREYSTKGEYNQLIQQDLTQSRNSTVNTQSFAKNCKEEKAVVRVFSNVMHQCHKKYI